MGNEIKKGFIRAARTSNKSHYFLGIRPALTEKELNKGFHPELVQPERIIRSDGYDIAVFNSKDMRSFVNKDEGFYGLAQSVQQSIGKRALAPELRIIPVERVFPSN
jgi:hypothetical protein